MNRTARFLAALLCAALSAPVLAFDGIRITFLAPTAGAPAQVSTMLVEAGDEIVLIGCGPGAAERLRQRGLSAGDVTAIFLTDLQPHHVAGCREMWQSGKAAGVSLAIPVWGPTGTQAFFSGLDDELALVGDARSAAMEIRDNIVYQPEGMTVTAIPADGSGGTRYGYRIDAFRRSVAFAGSAGFSEAVARGARNAQVLLQELAPADAPESSNKSPEEAGKLFRAARPYLAIYMNVIADEAAAEDVVRRTSRTYNGPVQIARNMMVIEIQNEVQIRGAPSSSE